jgi:hypothetical protein
VILGIVLAGGNAERWQHYPKELLPIGNGITLLDRTIDIMKDAGTDKVMFMTNIYKEYIHRYMLKDSVDYFTRVGLRNIWYSIIDSFVYQADWNLYAMPDTYYPLDAFKDLCKEDFNIGWFKTSRAERFGVISDNQIVDKQHLPAGQYQAWGVLAWSKKVVDFWMRHSEITTHTQAFNMAMDEFGFSMKQLEFYYDMASWDDYKEFIQGEV